MCTRTIFGIFLMVNVKILFSQPQGPVVKIPGGYVVGKHIRSYEGRAVTAFEGIPYAKPPVGQLRFKEPQPADPWSGVLVANKTYVCMQYTAIVPTRSTLGTEDCLYLYVYVPRVTINGSENLDVVVHIHGGAFITGDPTSSSGPGYIMDRDLIFVSMNYRLGILGFLSTEDDVVPGNNGLKDQTLSLKWVKDNIKLFGGNPDSITLTGASSGASCAHYHYLSPLSKGLFHRGFSQSGTALNHWALTKNPSHKAKKLGELFSCNAESSQMLVECLRRTSAEEVTLALGSFFLFANIFPSAPFAPVIEHGSNAFLPDHPYKLLKEGKINDLPWITSNVRDEGIVPVGFFILFGSIQVLEAYFDEVLPYTLGYHDSTNEADKTFITTKVKDYYLRNRSISMDNINDLVRLFSDRLFLTDGIKATRLHASVSKSPVYYYFFDYLLDIPVGSKANLKAVAHGDDSKMLYYQSNDPTVLSESDGRMKNIFIDFLYSFATTGKPNVKDIEWKPVTAADEGLTYMQISSPNNVHMASIKEIGFARFWNSLPIKENEKLFKI